jgi:two-component system sensor histidine kinase/response regulator
MKKKSILPRILFHYGFILLLSLIVAAEVHTHLDDYQLHMESGHHEAGTILQEKNKFSLHERTHNLLNMGFNREGVINPLYNHFFSIFIFVLFFSVSSLLLSKFTRAIRRAQDSEKQYDDVQKELIRSNKLFTQILENLPGVVFVKDVEQDYRIIMINRAFEEFSGLSREAIVGKTDYDLHKKAEADFFRSIDTSVMSSGKIIDVPCEIVTNMRGESMCHTKKVPIFDEDGKPQYLVGLLEDITERKRTELELANYRENLENIVQERTEKLRLAIQKAEEANRLKSEFLATMSHEIRSPMSGVIGMAELLLDTSLNEEQKGLTKTILNSGEVLLNIIEDILDFSKIEANKMELDPVAINMLDIVDDVCMLYSTRARDKALEIAVRYVPGSEQFVYADPIRMRQVLGNLINNAIKFTENGHIIITVEENISTTLPEDKVSLTFSIQDTGIGIDANDQERVFEKFSQANSSTTRNYGGTGLGLSICRKLVELMGGTMNLESALGKGSTFSFTLPLTRNREEINSPPNPPILKDLKVLIVDDLPIIRTMVSEQLSNAGMVCDCAENGLEALARLATAREDGWIYDIVIIDYLMPGMNGEMLARAINDEADFRDICLIMLTAAGNPVATDSYAEKGFSAYISKPVRVRQFIETLAVIWEKYNNGYKGTLIRFDTQSLDKTAFEAKFISLEGTRILLVEDSRLNQAFAEEVLAQILCDVTTVSNGQEAIDILAHETFDLVLMDCQMPVMDGFEASRRICQMKAENLIPATMPIIALTANAMKGDKQRCMEAGMDDYITKPVRKNELKEKIYTWVHGKGHDTVSTLDNAQEASFDMKGYGQSILLDMNALNEARTLLKDKFDYMVDCYIEDVENYLIEMKEAIQKQDLESLIRPAHTIKSTSKRMGAMALSDLARDIERMARAAEEEKNVYEFWESSLLTNSIQAISQLFETTRERLLQPRDQEIAGRG